MRLKRWAVVASSLGPYAAPERHRQRLHGNVFGHPRFSAGESVTTSIIVGKVGGMVRTESGSLYELSDIDVDYDRQFPGARERLFETLPEVS